MTTEQLLMIINGILLALVGYFLKDTMDKQKAVIKESGENKQDLLLLKQSTESALLLHKQDSASKHSRLEEKLDDLKDVIVTLTEEIKTLNKK